MMVARSFTTTNINVGSTSVSVSGRGQIFGSHIVTLDMSQLDENEVRWTVGVSESSEEEHHASCTD